MQVSQGYQTLKSKLWLNGHAFAEHVLCDGSPLSWGKPAEFAGQYRSLQGIVTADRLNLPVLGFFDDWILRNPHIVQRMSGKSRLRFALKKFLTDEAMRAELIDFVAAVCAMVEAEIFLELPSNSSLIIWAHSLANPGVNVNEMTDVDIDSTSVYLADTVRQLKATGLDGIVATIAEKDVEAGAEVELYKPLINVAENYRWGFAFRRPGSSEQAFDGGDYCVLGASNGADSNSTVRMLDPGFWQAPVELTLGRAAYFYAELPAFVEPEIVRRALTMLR
ncbi:MAG: hypothetical protein CMN85_04830 [Spongiibacteraceae bacterium]|nr:hypothetical protein [Spongiibacteraceae bacterium]